MAIAYPDILALRNEGVFAWSDKEPMLYALAVGAGSQSQFADRELKYVYEAGLQTLPTFATVAARLGFGFQRLGVDPRLTLHGEQSIAVHRPLPAVGSVRAASRIADVTDKGVGRGALIVTETQLHDGETGAPMATLRGTIFARGDGGFGGPRALSAEAQPWPNRPPDASITLSTQVNQALIYRLCGDRNPLHADPGLARSAGFARPILHGLCSYGMACRAVLLAFGIEDPSTIRGLDVRFGAPLLPGDALVFELWRDGDAVSFQARAGEADTLVLKGGHATLSASGADL